jgi:hypothetical protein
MAELTAADVDSYTKGRLPASDPETIKILNRALAACRRYCEWHVTPQVTNDVVTLDGPGNRVLMLPTMQLQQLNSVTEYNQITGTQVALDLTTIEISAGGAASMPNNAPVRLRKKMVPGAVPPPVGLWGLRWTHHYSGIVVNMNHGFLEAQAEDWRNGVLDACDRCALEVGRGGMQRFHVDDVVIMWFEKHENLNTRVLDPYRLMAPA